MRTSSIEKTAVLSIAILLVGSVLTGVLWGEKTVGDAIGGILLAATIGVPFWLLSRLQCPNCKERLSKQFPIGGLLLIVFAKDRCKSCGHEFGKRADKAGS
jgi:hypothetical protein